MTAAIALGRGDNDATGPYALVGFAHALPEKSTELAALLLSFVAPTRAEEGCLEYHFHADKDTPNLFVFYEVWRSLQDLQAHVALPHMQAFLETRMTYLSRDVQIHWLAMHSSYPQAFKPSVASDTNR